MFGFSNKLNKNNDINDSAHGGMSINTALGVFSLVILLFVIVSAYANFDTWTAGKEGIEYLVFGAVGVGSEILGAIMLIFAIRFLSSK